MNIEDLRAYCLGLKGVTEDVKWDNDLCLLVGGKMFCVTNLEGESRISFKVPEGDYGEISTLTGIIPAPYMARNKWVQVQAWDRFADAEWEFYVKQSYELVKAKLTKKLQKEIDSE
ncbi:MmcQ/YjbR family DNA-binding protein [uncultured Pontibacter sp.]|uniref:MmcQ/YjbR family DNA-binding protein n=1 Tax=uncultured Pontibacter sp. TaxID=453356 RepID=UPI002611AE59|nr:MmcQ/YjbR family DNA-binding protein [uncultured Pontibacter sp.]